MSAVEKTYVVQENGQVTLPKELREEFGIRKGDGVIFQRTAAGWTIKKQEADPFELLDELGTLLRAKGISLEEWVSTGRDIRAELLKEYYDLDAGRSVSQSPNLSSSLAAPS